MAHSSVATRKNTSTKPDGKSRTPSARKPAIRKSLPAGSMNNVPSAAERHEMIRVAAYYLAEQRGFAEGDSMTDWLAAEARVDEMLRKAGITLIH